MEHMINHGTNSAKNSNHGNHLTHPNPRIIVAVDFGTTYSGLCWAATDQPHIQESIARWPDAESGGQDGDSGEKVPTEITYDGYDYKWGFQAGHSGPRYRWFKLFLDPQQRWGASATLANTFPDPTALPLEYTADAMKLATDYLTALRKHAEHMLRLRLPVGIAEKYLLQFVITVPAVWSDAAQARTRLCAEKAGMGLGSALHIISEPEAAAVFALDTINLHTININVGSTFVLVDAGGGTVDLISYTITALKPVLQVREACPGSGSLCGSSLLDRIFRKMLQGRFGNEPDWNDSVLEEVVKQFESGAKRRFRGTVGGDFKFLVPGLRDNHFKRVLNGRLHISKDEVEAIFKPVTEEVINLVLGQIHATHETVSAVLLVGGFGQSPYLRQRIQAAIGGIQVIQPSFGWTAVVRGALMKGLDSTSPNFAAVRISGRSARKHYGISSLKKFDISIHEQSRREWSPYEGRYRIHTMDWFITKGSIVEDYKPFRLPYWQHLLVSCGRPQVITVDIYACSDPGHEGAPLYPNGNVVRLVELRADLRNLPEGIFPRDRGADSQMYYTVAFEVEVSYSSAYTKYELIYNGVNYGAVAADYV